MGVKKKVDVVEQSPPEQVTLVYRTIDGAHSFSALEVPGLVVLDHDLRRAFHQSVEGVGSLVSLVCGKTVKYEVALSFENFKAKVDKQAGTANRDKVVTVPVQELVFA